MGKTVILDNGYLVLTSKEAEELFFRLTNEGIFWEYISGIFDDSAKGVNTELALIKRKLDSLERKFENFSPAVPSLPPASAALEEVAVTKQEVVKEVPKLELNPKTLQGKGMKMLNKMKGMRRP